MKSNRPDLVAAAIILVVILLFVGLTWANYNFAVQRPGGNDFIPRWLGTRLFITERASPYSDYTSGKIQNFFYDRPARGEEDRALFVYPHYSMIVFVPFSLVEDYPMARALWMTVLEFAVVGVAFLSLGLVRWKPALPVFAVYFLFTLIWYHSLRPIINGNAAVLVALFITLAFYSIFNGQDLVAGIFLAMATIKPQMAILIVPFVIYWGISKRRWRLWISTIAAILVLIVISMQFESDWIIQNLRQILVYPDYSPPGIPGAIFQIWWPDAGKQLGWLLSAVLALLLIREWIGVWGKDLRWFLWTAVLTLVITNLIGIPTATANYVALFPALTLIFYAWKERWGRNGNWLSMAVMAGFLVGLWILFVNTLRPGMGAQPVQAPIMFFPLPIFLLFGLYWIRWWAVSPFRLGTKSQINS